MPTPPITPDQVAAGKQLLIPDVVFEVFNYLITLNWNGSYSLIRQGEVVKMIQERLLIHTFDMRWLDIEPAYRNVGWSVVYDRPGYNETYEPTFKFTRHTK